jgi:hypothetical protein
MQVRVDLSEIEATLPYKCFSNISGGSINVYLGMPYPIPYCYIM